MTSPVKGYALSPEQVVDGDRYSAVESRLLDALADETLPMFQRLWVAARTLEAEVHGAMVRTEDYRVECVPEMTAAEQILAEAYAPFWLGCLAKLRPELKPLATLRPRAKEPRDPARASRWLRSTLLSKDLAYQFDMTVAMTALVVLYLALLSFESQSDSLPDESYWYVLGTISNHNKLGEMFRLVFESAENFRTEMGDPLAPVMFLAWLAQTTQASETP
jgi:hypothetical protein